MIVDVACVSLVFLVVVAVAVISGTESAARVVGPTLGDPPDAPAAAWLSVSAGGATARFGAVGSLVFGGVVHVDVVGALSGVDS